ncbi:hypothetical protein D1007_18258 [Hordeum vulgare]|nr:hypothetical protein D1007_18258 [Hordeum vulgare]
MDGAVMAAMHADPQTWEENLAIEAIVEALHANTATRLTALNDSSWCFFEGYACAFDEEDELFSQHDHAFFSSRGDKLVRGQAQATHHYEEGAHDVEASPSPISIVIGIFDDKNEGLGNRFTEEEVWAAILASPVEKASRLDDFSRTFYYVCWGTIKSDVMAIFVHFYSLVRGNFEELKTMTIVLLTEKDGGTSVGDFRPISLIHSIAKLITEVLSMRMAFMIQKTPALLLKLDIAKAFNSVSWEYLLKLVQRLGISARWRDWITALMSSSSSACSLNVVTDEDIIHQRGLRQGNTPSPLLFIIAIDPLHMLLEQETGEEILQPLPGGDKDAGQPIR